MRPTSTPREDFRALPDPAPLPVTVIIPAYNRPEMTHRAVRSALGQRPRPPAEVIVIDDCSTDATGQAAAEAGARVIRHERNLGEAGARNTGVAAASQPWIGLLDSDDEWLPGLLATLWPMHREHVLLAGSALYRGPDPASDRYAGPTLRRPRVLRSPAELLYPENVLPASGVLVRTDAIRTVGGFDARLKFCADLDVWLRVLERGTGILSPDVVVNYHLHPGQVTQDRDGMAQMGLAVLRSYADRSWWSGRRVEAWRGGAAWDRLRRELAGGQYRAAATAGAFILRRPVRVAGLLGILVRRRLMRRRTRLLG